MRGDDGRVHSYEWMELGDRLQLRDIKRTSAQLPTPQPLNHAWLVHHASSTRVDEEAAPLHVADEIATNEIRCPQRERAVDGDAVTDASKMLQRFGALNIKCLCCAVGHHGVMENHVDAKRLCTRGNAGPNRPHSNQPEYRV